MADASRREDGSFDITITLQPTPQGYKLNLAYPPDVWPDTIEDAFARASRYLAQERMAARMAMTMNQARAVPLAGPDGRPLNLRGLRG